MDAVAGAVRWSGRFGGASGAIIGDMDLGTRLFTRFRGTEVGRDRFGNIYYEERRARTGMRRRRWVMYARSVDASEVPAEWHGWMHYSLDAPLAEEKRYSWQQEHQPNLTGTPAAYRPPGHDLEGGRRARATGDYEAWTPESDTAADKMGADKMGADAPR